MEIDPTDTTRYKLRKRGLQILGSGKALRKNIEEFPTYDDLYKRHSEHFKVKERMRKLGM